ncbi:MAG: CYTH domain-containing protein [Muribaculaceae bacterium]|nr:CYTH domain-containing protein [Muribaculaceae bacterium]
MATEIERKFMVEDMSFKDMAVSSSRITQGYLSPDKEATVRVRTRDDHGYLTVKGPNKGAVRSEWEYEIPIDDAIQMLSLSRTRVLDKTRYIVPYDGHNWEVDEFHGALEGLILAEIELPSEDTEVSLPPFVGREVTGDTAYYNSALAMGR